MVNLHAPTGEWAVRTKNGSGAFGIPERMPPVGGDCYGKQAFDMIEAQASRVPQTYGRTCRLTGKGRLPKDFLPIRAENPGTTQNMRRTVTYVERYLCCQGFLFKTYTTNAFPQGNGC